MKLTKYIIAIGAGVTLCVMLAGCDTIATAPGDLAGAGNAVDKTEWFVAGHLKAARDIIAVQKTPAAALALEHIDTALAAINKPREEDVLAAIAKPSDQATADEIRQEAKEAISEAAATREDDKLEKQEQLHMRTWRDKLFFASGIAAGFAGVIIAGVGAYLITKGMKDAAHACFDTSAIMAMFAVALLLVPLLARSPIFQVAVPVAAVLFAIFVVCRRLGIFTKKQPAV